MTAFSRFFLPFLFLTLFLSCEDDDKEVSDVAFIVTPKASEHITVNAGDVQRYEMELYTVHDYISRIVVMSFNTVKGEKTELDTLLKSPQEKFVFDYQAPFFDRDSVTVTLTFKVWDNEGMMGTSQRSLLITSNAYMIAEKSGIVLRSADSGLADALSFSNPSKTFSWTQSPDSIHADLYLVSNDDFSELSFASKTKGKMVRINEYDYAAAEPVGLQSVYRSSKRSDVITSLKTNDIILVGHGDKVEGVINITNIIRTGDSFERCVQLSFKGLRTE